MKDYLPHSLSIVVPVYNAEDSLPLLVNRLQPVLDSLRLPYEIIFINDGSHDSSWEVILELANDYSFVRGINLMRNYGQHNAILCGIRAAHHEVIITMDDDLQHPPEEIPNFLNKLAEGYDVVYGIPRKLPHVWWRNFTSLIAKRLLSMIIGLKTVREIGSYRALRTDLRRAFENYRNPGIIVDALLAWGTTRFASIPVDEAPREQGVSNYNFFKLLSLVFLILTGYSTMPLRVASLLGFGLTAFGLVTFFYVLFVSITQGSLPGFPFLASVILLFSGTQLFALGIFGEYLARIFDRSMDRPAYMIDTETPSR
ncbi:MAG: glycosyltransferase family 2 protein [Anaerolineae bacterium]|nr:glycosyltransferase family 2 protein [Anaerolineae bacterium]